MKIAIVTDTYHPNVSGVAYFTSRLIERLIKRGHDLLLITPSSSTSTELQVGEKIETFGVGSVPVVLYRGLRWAIIRPSRSVEYALSRFGPHVIHVQTHFALGGAAIRAGRQLGIPVLGTNHFMPENLVHH